MVKNGLARRRSGIRSITYEAFVSCIERMLIRFATITNVAKKSIFIWWEISVGMEWERKVWLVWSCRGRQRRRREGRQRAGPLPMLLLLLPPVLVLLPSHFFLYLTALYSDICIPQGTDANVMRLGEGYDYGIDIWALGRQPHRLSLCTTSSYGNK